MVGGGHCEESKAFGEQAFPFSRTVWYLCAENLHRDANFHPFNIAFVRELSDRNVQVAELLPSFFTKY